MSMKIFLIKEELVEEEIREDLLVAQGTMEPIIPAVAGVEEEKVEMVE